MWIKLIIITRAKVFGAGFDEIKEASTAIELGQKQSSIGLRIRGFDPLKTGSYATVFAAPLTEDSAAITAHSHW